jgi:DASS family divalent anion:Na+ symporter
MSDWSAASEALLSMSSFRELPRNVFARLLSHVSERTLSAGETLFQRGEKASAGFFVLEGDIAVDGRGTEYPSPALVGEEAAIGLSEYLDTVVAQGPLRVLVLTREALETLSLEPRFRKAMLASLGHRRGGGAPDPKLQPVNSGKWNFRAIAGWLLAIITPATLIIGFNNSALFPNAQSLYMVAVLSATIAMWLFRLLPDFVPALFAVLSVVVLGLAPPEVALGGFASTTFFMALSIFGLSTVIANSGLSYRILLWLLRVGPANKVWYNSCLFLMGAILTPIIPSANGRISLMAPFNRDLLDALGRKNAQYEGPRLVASTLGGATLLSPIFLTSKSVNFLIFGLLPLQEQERFQWSYWFYAASVVGLIVIFLNVISTWLLFRNPSRPTISPLLAAAQLRVLGPLRPAEWAAVIGLAALVLSLFTQAIHHIDIPWIALSILFCLLMFDHLSTSEFRRQIDWAFLLFLACLIGVVETMVYIGLDVWLGSQLGFLKNVMANNFLLFVALLAGIIFLVRFALPINATVVIFATILIPTAVSVDVNPWLVGFIILVFSECFIWPYQSTYYSLFQTIVAPEVNVTDWRMLTLNSLKYPIVVIAIYASFPFWKNLGLL